MRVVHHQYNWSHFTNKYITIDSTITPDPLVTKVLNHYSKRVNKVMGKVIGRSTGVFKNKKPEGSLGNLVADAIRTAASRIMERDVNIGLMTNSSIDYKLPKGNITRRMIYNILPYNNKLVILELNGTQVRHLVNEIAQDRGDPESGIRMRISGNKAADVLIGRHTLNKNHIYYIATNDYLANGGGDLSALWKPVKRLNQSISIRKCVEEYINNRSVVTPFLDGRIR